MKKLLWISLFVFINLSLYGQRAYVIDLDKTLMTTRSLTGTDTISVDHLPSPLKEIDNLILTKRYGYIETQDTIYLADVKNKLVYKKPANQDARYVLDTKSPYRYFSNQYNYQEVLGDFSGTIGGNFAREYIITPDGESYNIHRCAIAIPFVNVLGLAYTPSSFPIMQEVVIDQNGTDLPVRMLLDLEKTSIPEFLELEIKVFEIETNTSADRCPNGGSTFMNLDKKLLQNINRIIHPYQAGQNSFFYEEFGVPSFNGLIEKVVINENNKPSKVVYLSLIHI